MSIYKKFKGKDSTATFCCFLAKFKTDTEVVSTIGIDILPTLKVRFNRDYFHIFFAWINLNAWFQYQKLGYGD